MGEEEGGSERGAESPSTPQTSLHAKLYLWSGLPGGWGVVVGVGGVVAAAGCSEVPSKELPATLSLRLPAPTRAHSLLHPLPLFQNINLGRGSALTKQMHNSAEVIFIKLYCLCLSSQQSLRDNKYKCYSSSKHKV